MTWMSPAYPVGAFSYSSGIGQFLSLALPDFQRERSRNFQRARELSATGDYYGAIVLLKQTVNFAPDHAEAWLRYATRRCR